MKDIGKEVINHTDYDDEELVRHLKNLDWDFFYERHLRVEINDDGSIIFKEGSK